MANPREITPTTEETVEWPNCSEAVLRTYDFAGTLALSSAVEGPFSGVRSLAEKARTVAGVIIALFTYKD